MSQLAKVFETYDKFTVVDIPDLASSDLNTLFKGMHFIRIDT